MKIVGIISSPHKNGNGALLMKEVLNSAEQNGAQTETIFLHEKSINFCIGCSKCMEKGECIQSDDFKELKEKLNSADGLIFSSPNYAFSINGMMKKFLERLGLKEYMTSEVLGGKYIASIITAGGSNPKKIAHSLNGLGRNGIFKRAYDCGYVTARVGKTPVENNLKLQDEAKKLGKRVVLSIKSNKKFYFQNLPTRVITSLFVKPMFVKRITKFKDSNHKGIYDYLNENNYIKSVV